MQDAIANQSGIAPDKLPMARTNQLPQSIFDGAIVMADLVDRADFIGFQSRDSRAAGKAKTRTRWFPDQRTRHVGFGRWLLSFNTCLGS
jgi:hypothetical protein